MMQGTSKLLLSVCKEYLESGQPLNAMSVKELREVLEAIAEGLDQDPLKCQEVVDEAKKKDVEEEHSSS
jgi:hypothetical protein